MLEPEEFFDLELDGITTDDDTDDLSEELEGDSDASEFTPASPSDESIMSSTTTSSVEIDFQNNVQIEREVVPQVDESESEAVIEPVEMEIQSTSPADQSERQFVPEVEELERVRRNLFATVSERDVVVDSDSQPLDERPMSPIVCSSNKNESCVTVAEKPIDIKRLKSSPNESDDEGLNCSICFESWTNSGDHRVCSLRCGHLYGFSCIKRWLSGHDRKCPQCKHKSKCSDIRPLYARAIKALDTAERDSALSALEKEREVRRGLELELAQSRLRYQQAQSELGRLREQISRKACEVVSPMKYGRVVGSQSTGPRLSLAKTVDLCREGNCRVMSFLDYCSMVVVSQPNLNPLYPGFGLKKLNSLEYRAYELIAVHTKAIRDIAVNPVTLDGLVLTASMDKTLKLTSVVSNAVVQSFPVDTGAWSCIWNADNSFQFFAGLQNGKVLLFDTRGANDPIRELICCERGSPVSSLQYVKMNPLSHFGCGGLIVGQLNGCFFFESCSGGDEYRVNPLSFAEGPYTSVSLEPCSRHIMMTCRPSARHRNLRHLVCDLSQTAGPKSSCHCNILQTFYGGETNKMLSRGRLIRSPIDRNSTLACVGDESSSSVMIWDVGNGSKLQQLPVDDCILDICPISINNGHFLATLTEKKLNVFKWHV